MGSKLVVAFLILTFHSTLTGASESYENETSHSLTDTPQDPSSTFHGYLRSEVLQYSTPLEQRPEFNFNNLVRAGLQIENENLYARYRVDVHAAKSTNLAYQYIAVDELYAGSSNQNSGFFLGRKKEPWNQADTDWNLGLWQPLFQEDGLRNFQEGMTGLFYKKKTGDLQILILASPFFIPHQNSDLSEKNGTLISESRWMRSLPERVIVNNKEVNLTYRLKTPPLSDLLAKPGLAVRLQWDLPEEKKWASLAVARKPMNQLSIKYDAALVSRSVGVEGEAEVVPVVHVHNLASAELGFSIQSLNVVASALVDQPDRQNIENRTSDSGFQTDYYQQQPQPIQIFTLKTSSNVNIGRQELAWSVSFLKALSSATPDLDSLGNQQSSFVPYRTVYTQAMLLEGRANFGSQWQTQLKYLREFDQSGSLWSAEGRYQPNPQWSLFAGVDVLGVDQVSKLETDTRFLNSNRHNDRVFGGLNYVF